MKLFQIILGFQGLMAVTALVLIIWLIFRRIRKKKEETFEKRSN
jgi:multisubunit Na+/H+ antiporter MnhB subunit